MSLGPDWADTCRSYLISVISVAGDMYTCMTHIKAAGLNVLLIFVDTGKPHCHVPEAPEGPEDVFPKNAHLSQTTTIAPSARNGCSTRRGHSV